MGYLKSQNQVLIDLMSFVNFNIGQYGFNHRVYSKIILLLYVWVKMQLQTLLVNKIKILLISFENLVILKT